ncbi:MAG TPA: barstar family protein [Flavisolibacter sp.]|jgi:RNAse (barnase) inhibitor barstar|nr:barstar family protein [Flavisolibacter sp.]
MDHHTHPKPVHATIEGTSFNNLEGFFDEIDRVLTKDLTWKTGHNMNALNDILRGGFGVHGYEEPLHLLWKHHRDSRAALGEPLFEDIITLIREQEHIQLTLA